MSERDGAEVAIDVPLVRRLLTSQLPQWADLPITPVATSGLDNVMYRLGEDMCVRLPRYPRWVGQVEREQRWLVWLAPQLPLPIPVPLAKGEPGEGYAFPWSVYQWLDGETPTIDSLADPRQTAIELAEFVAALQRADPTGGPEPQWSNAFRGVPMGDPRDSLAVEDRVGSKLAALDGMIDTDAVTAVWEAALAAPAWDAPPVWIHGDLAPGNLLAVDGRLSAVIDFGTLAIGDPACDLLIAWTFLPADAREVFRAKLDPDDATWARGRGWGVAASLPVPTDPYYADHPDRTAAALRQLDELIADHQRHDAS